MTGFEEALGNCVETLEDLGVPELFQEFQKLPSFYSIDELEDCKDFEEGFVSRKDLKIMLAQYLYKMAVKEEEEK